MEMATIRDDSEAIRDIVFERLFEMQEGMHEYGITHDDVILKECMLTVLYDISTSARRLGYYSIAEFAESVMDYCWKTKGGEVKPCVEMITLLSWAIEWMLDEVCLGASEPDA